MQTDPANDELVLDLAELIALGLVTAFSDVDGVTRYAATGAREERCPYCHGLGIVDGVYCTCPLGVDLERVERAKRFPPAAKSGKIASTSV